MERNDTDAPVFGSGNDGNLQYQDRLTESGDAQLERDCTYIQMEPPDFMVSAGGSAIVCMGGLGLYL